MSVQTRSEMTLQDSPDKQLVTKNVNCLVLSAPGFTVSDRMREAFFNVRNLPATTETCIIETDCEPNGHVNYARPLAPVEVPERRTFLSAPPPGNRHERRKWLALQRRSK